MKKGKLFRFGTVVLIGLAVIAGCDDSSGNKQQQGNTALSRFPRGNYKAVTETGKIYQHLTELHIENTIATLDLMFDYEPDLLNKVSAASEPWNFYELYLLLGMGRKKDGIVFEEKMSEIAAVYHKAVESYAAALDYSFFDSLPGFEVVGGYVIEGGDILINPNSTDGLFELLLLKDREEGTLNETIDDIKKVVLNYGTEDKSGDIDSGDSFWRYSEWGFIFSYLNGKLISIHRENDNFPVRGLR